MVKKTITGRLVINDALEMIWSGFAGWPTEVTLLRGGWSGGEQYTVVTAEDGAKADGTELVAEVQALVDAYDGLDFSGELYLSFPGAGPVQKVVVTSERRAVLVHAIVHWPDELCPAVDRKQPHLMPVFSDRGFARLPAVLGDHCGEPSPASAVEVFESSAAEGTFLWLKVTQPEDLNDPGSAPREVILHLRDEAALKVSDQIRFLLSN